MRAVIGEHIKAVLLDWDDTAVKTIGTKWAQHKYVAQTYFGITLTDDDLRRHWGMPHTEHMKLLYRTDDVDTVLARLDETYARFPKRLFPDTVPVLRFLRTSGIKTGVVTSTTRSNLERDFSDTGLPEGLLDYTQTEDESHPHHKPDPRVFAPALTWLAAQSIQAYQVAYIGDGLNDMQAALVRGLNLSV